MRAPHGSIGPFALPGGDDAHRGRALFDAGSLAFWKGDDERSSSLQNRALELGRQTNNPTVTALALVGLARIALRTDVEEARRLCREALAVTEGTADRVGRSSAMHVLGAAAQMAGDFLEARELMSQRIAVARELGNLATVSSEAGNLSMVKRQLGNLDEAEALDIDYRRGDDLAVPWKINGLAAVATDRGEFDRAATLIGVADATMAAAGGVWPPDERQHYERTVAIITEAMGSAEFERARHGALDDDVRGCRLRSRNSLSRITEASARWIVQQYLSCQRTRVLVEDLVAPAA